MARLDLETVATRTRAPELQEEDRAATKMSTSGDLRPATEPSEGLSFGEPLFMLRDLSFWYGSKPALADVTMAFPINRVTALIGPSGCGKSTLLRCLNRMNELIPGVRLAGEVTYHGQDI